ncbi:MAG TPA: nucleotide exchange factor GrpE, partial [Planctomycetes bacterium]|nr:nucleotide exchange factor GrpE [Planctomycetota bacterium]
YKNLRRRALTDLEAGIQRAMQPLLEELLLVFDFLDMAMASPAEHPETKNLLTGIEMTRQKFASALEGSDVQEIPTDGAFDPRVHDATSTEETEEHEPGTILDTIRKGYTWQGRVLRPAQVVVAAAPESEEDQESEPDPGSESDENQAAPTS